MTSVVSPSMESYLSNLEYFSDDLEAWHGCEVRGTFGEKSFIIVPNGSCSSITVPIEHLRQIKRISSSAHETASCEFESSEGFFTACRISKQIGNFCAISHPTSSHTFAIARQSQLRYVSFADFSSVIAESFSNLILRIPSEITPTWTSSESFREMLTTLGDDAQTEQTQPNLNFFHNTFPATSPTHIRVLCMKDKGDLAKLIIETAIEHELKLTNVSKDKRKNLMELETFQRQHKNFNVPKKLVGMIIGAQGSNIKYMKRKYNVSITVNSKHNNENGDVQITIKGDNERSVRNCFTEMNLRERIVEVKPGHEKTLRKMSTKFLNDYALKTFFVSNEDYQDENGTWYRGPNLFLIGPEDYLNQLLEHIKYDINN